MRRYVLPGLVAVNIVFIGLFMWQWLTSQGELRNVRWSPPAPLAPVLTDAVLPSWSADLGSFMAALDRPLFSPTRKPPAKPEPPVAVVADILDDVRVLGLYSMGGAGGGAIVRAEGKIRRLRQGDSLGGWTIKEVRPLELVLARGSEQRILDVKRGPDLVADTAPDPAGSSTAGARGSGAPSEDRRQREADASKAAINALRARAGMPPLP